MKLFDRSVDLASFTEQTPLYPICRAWMENDPNGRNDRSSNGVNETNAVSGDSSDDEATPGVVNKMPRPNIPWNNIDESGKYRSPRIPDPVPRSESNLDRFLLSSNDAPPPETLLVDHLQHWKKVRQTWKLKSIENDKRHQDGMTLLRNIFMRASYNNSTS